MQALRWAVQDAVNSALINTENDKPIWAIVVVNKLDPRGGHVDYKIRMNFTTVPRTMKIVHKRRIGLLTYYKHYYTSGFLSLQVCSHCSHELQSSRVNCFAFGLILSWPLVTSETVYELVA